MENKMFCYQCQETAGCSGCTQSGVCGKKPDVAAAQDLLVYVTRGLSAVTTALRAAGKPVAPEINHLVTLNLFTTITNANFDKEAIVARIHMTLDAKRDLLSQLDGTGTLPEAAVWDGVEADFMARAAEVGVLATEHEDIRSLRELITYGLKGLSAYSKHANALLQEDGEVDAFLQRALAATLDDSLTVGELVELALETGRYGVAGMALLDRANTGRYGAPEITRVSIGVGKNPGILVSGHDLRDLEMLLEQTQGTGVDVYTHSEMLPAHYYPAFKKYAHFVGNYGNAWWKQKEEFESFNGPILMTTNCIVPPKESYRERLYTTGAAGYPGCKHISGGIGEEKDFSELIEHAKRCAPPIGLETGEIVGGFAHNQVLALADQIVDAVKSGAIRKFVVMAGCDGRAKSRNPFSFQRIHHTCNQRIVRRHHREPHGVGDGEVHNSADVCGADLRHTNGVSGDAAVARQGVNRLHHRIFFQFFDDGVLPAAAAYYEKIHRIVLLASCIKQCEERPGKTGQAFPVDLPSQIRKGNFIAPIRAQTRQTRRQDAGQARFSSKTLSGGTAASL